MTAIVDIIGREILDSRQLGSQANWLAPTGRFA
jgi:hypothetical protein